MCENGVCYKRPKQNKTEATASTEGTSSSSSSQLSNEEKLARAKELIEKKRIVKEEEDARVSVTTFKLNANHINFFSIPYKIYILMIN